MIMNKFVCIVPWYNHYHKKDTYKVLLVNPHSFLTEGLPQIVIIKYTSSSDSGNVMYLYYYDGLSVKNFLIF